MWFSTPPTLGWKKSHIILIEHVSAKPIFHLAGSPHAMLIPIIIVYMLACKGMVDWKSLEREHQPRHCACGCTAPVTCHINLYVLLSREHVWFGGVVGSHVCLTCPARFTGGPQFEPGSNQFLCCGGAGCGRLFTERTALEERSSRVGICAEGLGDMSQFQAATARHVPCLPPPPFPSPF